MSADKSRLNQLRRIAESASKVAAQGREAVTVGPFQGTIDPSSDMIWLSYAVPVAPLGSAGEVALALAQLQRLFRERRRTLRFEFSESLWPELPAALQRAGLQLQARQPLMLCAPADFQPFQAPEVEVRLLDSPDDTGTLATFESVQSQAFGFEGIFQIPQLREHLRRGSWRCALASLNGVPAGGGCTMPLEGVAELAGVGTVPALRRRGVASALSSFLVRDHFQRGGDLVWLSAGDAVAEAVYRRTGFRVVDAQLNYIQGDAV